MTTFIIGLFLGGVIMSIVMSCFSVGSYNKGYEDGGRDVARHKK